MLEQTICPCCHRKPTAINYKKNGRTYYHKKCIVCYRKKRKVAPAGWLKSGYKKKEKCERCGFRFKFPEQSSVYHVDGNVENNDWMNLKTVCCNCEVEIKHTNLPWKPSALIPDR